MTTIEDLLALLTFAVNNEDKFTEWDPDLVKHQWIEAVKKAVESVKYESQANNPEIILAICNCVSCRGYRGEL